MAMVGIVMMAGCAGKANKPTEHVGKLVLVGVSLVDPKGTLLKHVQVHGTLKEIDSEVGIILLLSDSHKEFYLPPVINFLRPVAAGTYRERASGRVVSNPDFVTVWEATVAATTAMEELDWTKGMEWHYVSEFDFPGEHWTREMEH